MSFRMQSVIRQAMAALSLACAAAGAQAGTYTFTQGGFDDGSTVHGYFTANDLNHDGKITTNELTDLYMQVLGGKFDHWIATMGWYHNQYYVPNSLTYNIGSKILGDEPGEQIWAEDYEFIYSINHNYPNMVGDDGWTGQPAEVYSSSPIYVTDPSPAPEPGTWAMLLAGLMLLPAALKRNRKRG